MPKVNRIPIIVAVIAVAGGGLLALRRYPNAPTLLAGVKGSGEPARAEDAPSALAEIAVPFGPTALAWSADGRYLAAGTWGRKAIGLPDQRPRDSDVYVVDVAKASVAATLETTDSVECLSLSPDGKWLAVGCRVIAPTPATAKPAEMRVFAIPKFTAEATFKARSPGDGFVDLDWSAYGRSLYAIDGPLDYAAGTSKIRRWTAPAFTEAEQPAIPETQKTAYLALAVSPEGRTLAVAERVESGTKRVVRLFDLAEGAERLSLRAEDNQLGIRLGFTPDCQAVGVLDRYKLAWWDAKTGREAEPAWDVLKERPAKPSLARFASQPAGLSHISSWDSVSPDGGWRARGEERHRGLGDLGFDDREKEFGSFIHLTERTTAKTRKWRVDKSSYSTPPVAFSPDGKKLAYAVGQPVGSVVRIMAVPK